MSENVANHKTANNPDWRPTASLDTLKKRAELYAQIRHFFAERGVTEVDTPLLSSSCVTDPYVDNIPVGLFDDTHYFLQTSPEYAIKRLLAAGMGDCYQLGKAFRQEDEGRQHRREFTMLEWYRLDWDAQRLCTEVLQLLAAVGINASTPVQKTYRDWFMDVLDIDPLDILDLDLRQLAQTAGHLTREQTAPDAITRDECLDLLMCTQVEPALKQHAVAIITEFPASRAALARLKPDNPAVAERFEIYLHGVECANGYHELLDAETLQTRFATDNRIRANQQQPIRPIDQPFLAAMQAGLPPCSGVALGVDRLLMALLKLNNIADTLI